VTANPDALAAIRRYCLTGHIEIDAELLQAVGFQARETDQLYAANEVRIEMQFYSFREELTIDNAERLLAEHRAAFRGGETG